ncbi:MAG: M56 family metallopeptidase, partial [Thermoanaerobaculia bacterium]
MNAMVMSWVVTYLMHSTLLIAAVWIGARWIRSAAARDALWKLALAGAIVTASLQVSMPVRVWKPAPAPRVLTIAEPQRETPAPVVMQKEKVARPVERERILRLDYLWASIAALLLARLLYGLRRLRAILRDRREIVSGSDRALLDALAPPRLVRLTESSAIRSPMAMLGWEIVVPHGIFARLTEEQRRTILAHELAHLVRRDPLWLAIGEVLKAVLFFQPLNFLAVAKMKETAEFLCDDAAVLQTGDRQALAETLAELASSVVPMPTSVAAMAEGGSNLIARVSRVLRAGVPDLPLRMRWRLTIGLVPLVLVALLAPGVAPALVPMATIKVDEAEGANHFKDGNLVHTYIGNHGFTKITMDAKNVSIAFDGSWVRFDDAAGFYRARYTAERGEEQLAQVTPGRNLEPVYRYVVGGRERAWNDDATRLLIAAFSSKELDEIKRADDARPKETKPAEWNATIEETGSRDDVPLDIRIHIDSFFYDKATGEIDLERSGTLRIEEIYGDRERSFTIEDGEAHLIGSWDGMSHAERKR